MSAGAYGTVDRGDGGPGNDIPDRGDAPSGETGDPGPDPAGTAGGRERVWRRYDMHVHLETLPDPDALLRTCASKGIALAAVTTAPEAFGALSTVCAGHGNVALGLGLHPWWAGDEREAERQAEDFARLAPRTRLIGEVGLDFGPRAGTSAKAQVDAFDRVLSTCKGGGKVLSIHAVRSAGTVLDMLERHGTAEDNVCIFHWFSGTDAERRRAVDLGCLFSVGEAMLATRRGRAYARALPADRLLLETDFPRTWGEPFGADDLARSLDATADAIDELLGRGSAERIAETSAAVLAQAVAPQRRRP